MSTNKILLIAFWSAFGIVAGYWVVKIFWRVRSALQRRAATIADVRWLQVRRSFSGGGRPASTSPGSIALSAS